jgi:hypothetical protein
MNGGIAIEGRAAVPGEPLPQVDHQLSTPDYFRVLGSPCSPAGPSRRPIRWTPLAEELHSKGLALDQLVGSDLARIGLGEVFEGFVEDEDIDGAVLGLEDSLTQGYLALHSNALAGDSLASVADENVAHELEVVAKKMSPALLGDLRLLDEAVLASGQRGGLEGVVAALDPHVAGASQRNSPKT